MARNLSDAKVGDILVTPKHQTWGTERGKLLGLDENIVVKVARKYLYVQDRYWYDRTSARGADTSYNATPVSIATGEYRHRDGIGSPTPYYTPAQWEAREVLAAARQRFSDAVGTLASSGIDRLNLNWGARLDDVPDEAIVELLDDLTATIEAHRRRWGTT